MSTLNYTSEQAQAIKERKVSVALSAGAGCGKTFVLTERFLAHLEPQSAEAPEPAELSELVAITFTDRAAREMRDRIRQKCYDRLAAAVGEDAAYWMALLRAIDRARVSTIHGFCASLLRAHAVEAQLDPQFAILEQSHAATLAAEVIDDLLRDKLSSKDELTISLVTDLGLDKLRGYLHHVLHARSELNVADWLQKTPAEQVELWHKFHTETVLPLLLEEVVQSPPAQTALRILHENEFKHPVMSERRAVLLSLLPDLPRSKNAAVDMDEIREAAKVQGAGGKSIWPDTDIYDEYNNAAKELRAVIDKNKAYVAFDAEGALPAAEAGLKLLELAADVITDYESRKRELGQLDFSDLLSRAHRLLTDPANRTLQQQVSAQIKLLLVDEFQDTDPLQVELVKALCNDVASGRLFFVGDFKQSIYRFRGADPGVFRSLQEETPASGRLPLTQNFRSQPAILDFVNAVFCGPFEAEYEPLRPARPQVSPLPAVEFMWVPVESTKREKGATDRLRQEEADWIARRIRGLLDAQEPIVYDAKGGKDGKPGARAPKMGDIAILFRALTSVAHYEEALRAYGIDYYLVGGHAFYAQQEIFDLMNLLRALESPTDEISLLGALRSPFFALDDETIFWLSRQPGGLSAGILSTPLPNELTVDQRHTAERAASLLSDLRQLKDRLPIADLVLTALARTGYDAVLLTEFLGERKLANLRKLVDEARGFDRAGVFTLSDFIVQLTQFVSQQPREPLAATHSESTDVVRLMTIHQSKGLEFPVVFVPDVDRASHGAGDGIELHRDLGPLVRTDRDAPQSGYDLMQVINRRQDLAERTRLLYVACTRAADYLVLSGSPTNFDDPKGSWLKLLADRFDLQTGTMLGQLPPGYPEPAVRVTLETPACTQNRSSRPKSINLQRELAKAEELAKKKPPADQSVLPVAADLSARRQYSFSSLNGALQRMQEPPPSLLGAERMDAESEEEGAESLGERAAWAEREEMDARRFGTLVHAALAQISPQETPDVSLLVRRAASRLLAVEPVEMKQAEELIRKFWSSSRYQQLKAAAALHHELEFMLAWPPDNPEPESVYLQGFIDCLYQDQPGRWHILDYKTNQVEEGTLEQVAGQYEMQLYVYALAAEKVLREPPAELTLYFLRPGLEYSFPWNDTARAKVMTMIQEALAHCN